MSWSHGHLTTRGHLTKAGEGNYVWELLLRKSHSQTAIDKINAADFDATCAAEKLSLTDKLVASISACVS